MISVLLVNQKAIPHYRIPVYNYLSEYLIKYNYKFIVVAEGILNNGHWPIEFRYINIPISVCSLTKLVIKKKIDIIILWVNMQNLHLFPACFIIKLLLKKKIRYYFPWIWSLIVKILYNQNPALKRYNFITFFIKYGLNTEEKLLDFIYEKIRDISIKGIPITKEKIQKLFLKI